MWNSRFIQQVLHGSTLKGKQALLAGILAIAIPTLIRAMVGDLVLAAVFLTYVPFVILAAVLLRPRDAAIVALIASLSAEFFFMKPKFVFTVAPDDLFSIGFLLLISAMVIVLMTYVRRYFAHCLDPASDVQSSRVIFSERKGEAWAHWDGERPSVKLGPHMKVAEMMEDYVAQVELGERLTGQKPK